MIHFRQMAVATLFLGAPWPRFPQSRNSTSSTYPNCEISKEPAHPSGIFMIPDVNSVSRPQEVLPQRHPHLYRSECLRAYERLIVRTIVLVCEYFLSQTIFPTLSILLKGYSTCISSKPWPKCIKFRWCPPSHGPTTGFQKPEITLPWDSRNWRELMFDIRSTTTPRKSCGTVTGTSFGNRCVRLCIPCCDQTGRTRWSRIGFTQMARLRSVSLTC